MPIALPNGWIRVHVADATDDQIRDWIVHFASMLAGLSADPKTVDAYNAIIAPDAIEGHASALQKSMDEMWSCALTQDGIARLMLDDAAPEAKAKIVFLWRSYVNARAMIDEQNIGLAFGALHYRTDVVSGKVPLRRAMVHIIDAQSGATAHTYIQTTELDAAGRFKTIEGGSVDAKGFKAIEAGERLARSNGIITSVDGRRTHVLYCVIDMVAELRAAGVTIGVPAPVVAPPAPLPAPEPAPVAPSPPAPAPAVVAPPRAPVAAWLSMALSSSWAFATKHPAGVAIGLLVVAILVYELAFHMRARAATASRS